MGRRKSSIWYTVYEAYRDRLVVIGTSSECAAFMGCSVDAFHCLVSHVKSGKSKAYCVVIEDLEAGTYSVYGSSNTGELRGRPGLFDVSAASDLYASGCNDSEIARKLGVDASTIWTWRRKNGLPSVGRGRPRKALA